jgi:hypothetical protein
MGLEEKKDFFKILAGELKDRDNPTDLKSAIIAKVEQVTPKVIVCYSDDKIHLTEDEELIISEFFRFRCNIDKTGKLSQDVVNLVKSSNDNCSSAENVSETHSYTGSPCSMPDAIALLSSAIQSTNKAVIDNKNELLALKCNLKIGDLVLIASLEQKDRFVLIDKILEENYKFYDEE